MSRKTINFPEDLEGSIETIVEEDPHYEHFSQAVRSACRMLVEDHDDYGEAT